MVKLTFLIDKNSVYDVFIEFIDRIFNRTGHMQVNK